MEKLIEGYLKDTIHYQPAVKVLSKNKTKLILLTEWLEKLSLNKYKKPLFPQLRCNKALHAEHDSNRSLYQNYMKEFNFVKEFVMSKINFNQ